MWSNAQFASGGWCGVYFTADVVGAAGNINVPVEIGDTPDDIAAKASLIAVAALPSFRHQ